MDLSMSSKDEQNKPLKKRPIRGSEDGEDRPKCESHLPSPTDFSADSSGNNGNGDDENRVSPCESPPKVQMEEKENINENTLAQEHRDNKQNENDLKIVTSSPTPMSTLRVKDNLYMSPTSLSTPHIKQSPPSSPIEGPMDRSSSPISMPVDSTRFDHLASLGSQATMFCFPNLLFPHSVDRSALESRNPLLAELYKTLPNFPTGSADVRMNLLFRPTLNVESQQLAAALSLGPAVANPYPALGQQLPALPTHPNLANSALHPASLLAPAPAPQEAGSLGRFQHSSLASHHINKTFHHAHQDQVPYVQNLRLVDSPEACLDRGFGHRATGLADTSGSRSGGLKHSSSRERSPTDQYSRKLSCHKDKIIDVENVSSEGDDESGDDDRDEVPRVDSSDLRSGFASSYRTGGRNRPGQPGRTTTEGSHTASSSRLRRETIDDPAETPAVKYNRVLSQSILTGPQLHESVAALSGLASDLKANLTGRPKTVRHFGGSMTHQVSSTGPVQSSREEDHLEMSNAEKLSKDKKLAKDIGLNPDDIDDIINMSMDTFHEYNCTNNLSEEQITILKDIRRRGKNKVAAQNCRKRKMDQLEELRSNIMDRVAEKLSEETKLEELKENVEKWRLEAEELLDSLRKVIFCRKCNKYVDSKNIKEHINHDEDLDFCAVNAKKKSHGCTISSILH